MLEIIQLNKDELQTTIASVVSEVIEKFSNQKSQILSDKITDLDEVSQITNLKKSSIYKKTATGELPCSRFGNKKLIFSRKELLQWVDSHTVRNTPAREVMVIALAKEANEKKEQ